MTTPNLTDDGEAESSDASGAVDGLFNLHGKERLDAATRDKLLIELLAQFPDAPVMATNDMGLVVEMPASMPLVENPVVEARFGLDGQDAQNRATIIANWDRMLREGAARCIVNSTVTEGGVAVYALDIRESHGVILVLMAALEDSGAGLEQTEQALRAKLRFASMEKDEQSHMLSVDETLTEILGYEPAEMVGRRSLEFVHPDDHALAIDHWIEMLTRSGEMRRVTQRWRRKDGTWAWFEVSNRDLRDDPAHRCVVTEMVDVSDMFAAQEELRARQQLLDRLAATVPVGLVQIDREGQVVYTNERLHQMLGVEHQTTVEDQFGSIVHNHRAILRDALDHVLAHGGTADIEVEVKLAKAAEPRYCTVSLRALTHEDGQVSGAIGAVADVTDSARLREELTRRATFDELTGCYSRAAILRELDKQMGARGARSRRAVMFVDLDHFKAINDNEGHAAGDEILRGVGAALREAVRTGDLVGRIGGDEFLVVCPGIESAEAAMKLAERLATCARRGGSRAAGSLAHQLSIGVAWSDGDDVGAEALVAAADRAMYESKRERAGLPHLAAAPDDIADADAA